MTPLGDIRQHLTLVRRMARATGVDLDDAMQDGQLSNKDWADMVTNCRGCSNVAACQARLQALELAGSHDHAPEYCENSASFTLMSQQPA